MCAFPINGLILKICKPIYNFVTALSHVLLIILNLYHGRYDGLNDDKVQNLPNGVNLGESAGFRALDVGTQLSLAQFDRFITILEDSHLT